MQTTNTIGFDIAKSSLQAPGVDERGKTSLMKTLPRSRVLAVLIFYVIFICICVAAAYRVNAQDFSIIPRLSNGVLIYNFKLDNTFVSTGGTLDNPQTSGFQGFNVNDDLYYGGGGITATYKRFFLDISGLVTTEGSADVSKQTLSLTNIPVTSGILTGLGNGLQTSHGGKATFTHHEITALVGCDITESLRIFTGFKYAESPFNINTNTTTDVDVTIPLLPLTGGRLVVPGNSKNKSTFIQDGPFIGAGYSVPVDSLYGSFLINSAISYLHGDIHQKLRSQTEPGIANFTVLGIPVQVPFPATSSSSKASLDGTSVGINTGVGWSGRIPSTNIGYLMGADGSFYNFEADHSNSDFREISWRLRAELSYRF